MNGMRKELNVKDNEINIQDSCRETGFNLVHGEAAGSRSSNNENNSYPTYVINSSTKYWNQNFVEEQKLCFSGNTDERKFDGNKYQQNNNESPFNSFEALGVQKYNVWNDNVYKKPNISLNPKYNTTSSIVNDPDALKSDFNNFFSSLEASDINNISDVNDMKKDIFPETLPILQNYEGTAVSSIVNGEKTFEDIESDQRCEYGKLNLARQMQGRIEHIPYSDATKVDSRKNKGSEHSVDGLIIIDSKLERKNLINYHDGSNTIKEEERNGLIRGIEKVNFENSGYSLDKCKKIENVTSSLEKSESQINVKNITERSTIYKKKNQLSNSISPVRIKSKTIVNVKKISSTIPENDCQLTRDQKIINDKKCLNNMSEKTSHFNMNTVEEIKMDLFMESIRIHRGKSAERCFADYWDSLGHYLSKGLNRLQPLQLTEDFRSNIVGNSLQKFLITKKLRYLHNKLIFALMNQCYKSKVDKTKLKKYIPAQWKRKIEHKDLNNVYNISSGKGENSVKMPIHSQGLTLQKKNITSKMSVEPKILTGLENHGIDKSLFVQNGINIGTHLPLNESENTTNPSCRLPGALEIKPLILNIIESEGITASKSATRFLIIAIREYIAKILTHTITSMEDSSLSNQSLEVGTPKILSLRKRKLISSYNLAQNLLSNKKLYGRPQRYSSSRMAWERCLCSSGSKLFPSSPKGLSRIQAVMNNVIEGRTPKYCKVKSITSNLSSNIVPNSQSTVDREREGISCTSKSSNTEKVTMRPRPSRGAKGLGAKDLFAMKARIEANSKSFSCEKNESIVSLGSRAGAKNLEAMRERSKKSIS